MHFELRILIIYLITINIIAYLCMVIDKYLSKTKSGRIPENTLFLIAFLLGAPGIFLGMLAPIHHKSAKAKFKWGIPFLLVLNGALVLLMFKGNLL